MEEESNRKLISLQRFLCVIGQISGDRPFLRDLTSLGTPGRGLYNTCQGPNLGSIYSEASGYSDPRSTNIGLPILAGRLSACWSICVAFSSHQVAGLSKKTYDSIFMTAFWLSTFSGHITIGFPKDRNMVYSWWWGRDLDPVQTQFRVLDKNVLKAGARTSRVDLMWSAFWPCFCIDDDEYMQRQAQPYCTYDFSDHRLMKKEKKRTRKRRINTSPLS